VPIFIGRGAPARTRTLVRLTTDDLGCLFAEIDGAVAAADLRADPVAWLEIVRPARLSLEEKASPDDIAPAL